MRFYFTKKTCLIGIIGLCVAHACAQTTESDWQAKAVQKYPDLGTEGSPLNTRFIALYNAKKQSDTAFFQNPQWPMLLADEASAANPTAPASDGGISPEPSQVSQTSQTPSQTPNPDAVKWQEGPSTGDLGGVAQLQVPSGYQFAGADDTRTILTAMHDSISGEEVGLIAPENKGSSWFSTFEFDKSGYVPDDEKGSLDADAILKSLKDGQVADNKDRQAKGWSTLTVLDWVQKPQYNGLTHNLEWSFQLQDDSTGNISINYNTRYLGREGVMEVTLAVDQAGYNQAVQSFQNVLSGFSYNQGHTYSEFRAGDKKAEYGLTALIVGGAAAVATKAGLFKWLGASIVAFWKLIIAGFVAIGAWFKKLFSRKKTT
jgi:uncharacterized membrane-anchored protein